jgi:hypothetical protein
MTKRGKGTSKGRILLIFAAILFVSIFLFPTLGLSESSGLPGAARGSAAAPTIPSPGHPYWFVQIDYLKAGEGQAASTPWTDADFVALAKAGMNGVEINLDWADIEPQRDKFDFHLLDRYMAAAGKSHLKIYLLFWESVWRQNEGKNPPSWVTAREVTSDGIPADEPPWWDQNCRTAYFDYMAQTIDHVKNSPGFGGVYVSYGWLDAEWGPAPKGSHGVTGYASADIQAFYKWLPENYKTLASFNQQWHSAYENWSQIPVPRPGDRLFPVYQLFRHDSVKEIFDSMSRMIRAHTDATLLFSWGGGICGRGQIGPDVLGIGPDALGNDPDVFFEVAKKYHAIVLLDDADFGGLALLFGSLARSYGVSLLQEWTPRNKGLRGETSEWLGHIGLAAPMGVGEDFFSYPPPADSPGFADAWTAYQTWHATLAKLIRGKAPEQPVAVLVPTRKIELSSDLNTFPNLSDDLRDFWRHYYVLPHFITDWQVLQGTVNLEQFCAVVDLGNERAELPILQAYATRHPVLTSLKQSLQYLLPYVSLDRPTDSLEITPTVAGSTVWLTLANCNGEEAYSGNIEFDPRAVGLKSTAFDVTIVKGGESVPASLMPDGKTQWRISLPPAGFEVVRLSPRKSAMP